MNGETRRSRDAEDDPDEPTRPVISVCESSPDRSVFLEAGNNDGWISSDLTVTLDR